MEKKIIIVKEGRNGHNGTLPDILSANGWEMETFDFSERKSLSKNLEHCNGLFILSKTSNVLEQSTWPLTVRVDT